MHSRPIACSGGNKYISESDYDNYEYVDTADTGEEIEDTSTPDDTDTQDTEDTEEPEICKNSYHQYSLDRMEQDLHRNL